MRLKILFFFLFWGITKCYSQNLQNEEENTKTKKATISNNFNLGSVDSNTIVYFLPTKVEELLTQEIKNKPDSVYLFLETIDNGNFKISVQTYKTGDGDLWPKMTNRKVYLNSAFYPLILDYDWLFASSDKGTEILRKSQKDKYFEFGYSRVISHYFYYIEFKRHSGEVVLTGFDGAAFAK
jgi:hypothetical protein